MTETREGKSDIPDPLFVGTLEKGLRVLRVLNQALAEQGLRDLSLTEVASLASLERSAAQRMTHTLVKLGYLEKDPHSRRYRPALQLLDFYFTYMASNRLAEIAMPRIIEAAKVFDTTVNMVELSDTEIVYSVRIPHQKANYLTTIAGRRMPAFCTSSGVVMLAYRSREETADVLDRSDLRPLTEETTCCRKGVEARIEAARKNGYDLGISQTVMNEVSVAAPVLNAQGRAIGAVNIPVFMPQWSPDAVREKIIPLATETARAISGTLLSQE